MRAAFGQKSMLGPVGIEVVTGRFVTILMVACAAFMNVERDPTFSGKALHFDFDQNACIGLAQTGAAVRLALAIDEGGIEGRAVLRGLFGLCGRGACEGERGECCEKSGHDCGPYLMGREAALPGLNRRGPARFQFRWRQ